MDRIARRYDVVIAGAGPAGSVAAWLLAGAHPGLRVLLLDAVASPRPKPCGEYLAPGGVGALQRAGLLDTVLATAPRSLPRTAVVAPAGSIRVHHQPQTCLASVPPWGLGVRRELLDRALQRAAARRVDLRLGTRLVGMERRASRWRLALATSSGAAEVEAALLVGADGRGSLVRRRAGLDRPPRRRRFALACRAQGVEQGEAVEMHLGPMGQIGLCPLGGGEANLNLLLAAPSARLLRARRPEAIMRAALAATATLRPRVARAHLGPVRATGSLPQGSRSVVADGLCLLGDAAGFCDPFTGEGMTLALAGAEALVAASAGWTFETMPDAHTLRGYARAHARRTDMRRRIGEAVQMLLGRRPLAERAVAWMGRRPALAGALVAGSAGYRGV